MSNVGSCASANSRKWGGIERARFLEYVTEGPTGAPTTATGVLATPDGPAPVDGWPIVAWEHGTSGLGPACGISTNPRYDAPSAPDTTGRER
ncbi:hypothetical protein [Nocardia arthritidis]|uniref:hypothetical protein n=1 Tax=Nocardia arthritidis TaxID=228602 RepID=UPI0007A51331|nr:hypothetical protein [Nocardia arthritidis]